MAAVAEKARRRWFRITPDRCVLALLALEGFLWLSERFQWFAFNQHKGWTVLIAVGAVGVFLLLMFLWFLAALVVRWRFQFSILSLLVLMLVVAITCGWLATDMKKAREQREAVEWINKAGGGVAHDYQFDLSGNGIPGATPPGPPWLRKLLGDDLFVNVTDVSLTNSEVSDAGLEHLKGLTQLQTLGLEGTTVGDAELQHLKGLTELWGLRLDGTRVSDAGLQHLKELARLRFLSLDGTKVTDAGVEKLQQALPNCRIER